MIGLTVYSMLWLTRLNAYCSWWGYFSSPGYGLNIKLTPKSVLKGIYLVKFVICEVTEVFIAFGNVRKPVFCSNCHPVECHPVFPGRILQLLLLMFVFVLFIFFLQWHLPNFMWIRQMVVQKNVQQQKRIRIRIRIWDSLNYGRYTGVSIAWKCKKTTRQIAFLTLEPLIQAFF